MRNRAIQKAWLFLLAFLFESVLPQNVQAQLSISPVVAEVTVRPGGQETFGIGITNSGSKALNITVSFSPMEVSPAGLPLVAENAERGCNSWITGTLMSLALKPKENRVLRFAVRAPREACGGYYALIVCNAVPQKDSSPGPRTRANMTFSYRNLVPVMVVVPGGGIRAEFVGGTPSMVRNPEGTGYLMKVPIRNQGNIHARLAGKVEIRTEDGQVVETANLSAGRGYVLPAHERTFENKTALSLPDGSYLARVVIQVGDSTRPMFSVFPFYVSKGNALFTPLNDEIRARLQVQSAGFMISPQTLQMDLRQGERRMQTVLLANLTPQPIPLRVRVMEWVRTAVGDDLVTSSPLVVGRSGLGTLIPRQSEIVIPAKGKSRFVYNLQMPPGAKGEYYAALTFDRSDRQLDSSPKEQARRSVLVRSQAKGTGTRAVAITRFEAVRKPNGAMSFDLAIKNTGDVGISPEVNIRVLDKTGGEVGRPEAENPSSIFIQAGGEGARAYQFNRILDPGEYVAQVSVLSGANERPVDQRAPFSVMPSGGAPPPTPDKKTTATLAKEAVDVVVPNAPGQP